MRLLWIGDVFGRPGRDALSALLPTLRAKWQVDAVIVNIENASGGRGLTLKNLNEFKDLPIDVMTGGNHIWHFPEVLTTPFSIPLIRPYNTTDVSAPGVGEAVITVGGIRLGVLMVQGKAFMDGKCPEVDPPLDSVANKVAELKTRSDVVVVEMHAEATAEKRALVWLLDGRVSAVVGTHTHVQTADESILPAGTAYITDLGMTGPHQSVIGLDPQAAIARFQRRSKKYEVATGDVRLEGVLIDIDTASGRATSINRLRERYDAPSHDVENTSS